MNGFGRWPFGPTPQMEACSVFGAEDFPEQSSLECLSFLEQIARNCPIPTELQGDVYLDVSSSDSDSRILREVYVNFNRENPAAVDFADQILDSQPHYWDDEALAKLGIKETDRC